MHTSLQTSNMFAGILFCVHNTCNATVAERSEKQHISPCKNLRKNRVFVGGGETGELLLDRWMDG